MQSWKRWRKLCWRSWQWPLWLCVEVLKTLLVPISSSKCSNLIQIGCWVSFTAFLVGNCGKLFNMCKLKFFPLKILKKKSYQKIRYWALEPKITYTIAFRLFFKSLREDVHSAVVGTANSPSQIFFQKQLFSWCWLLCKSLLV